MLISTSSVFRPSARYDVLSDEAEERFDTQRLSHDAREDANTLLDLHYRREGGDLVCFLLIPGFFRCYIPQSALKSDCLTTFRVFTFNGGDK